MLSFHAEVEQVSFEHWWLEWLERFISPRNTSISLLVSLISLRFLANLLGAVGLLRKIVYVDGTFSEQMDFKRVAGIPV